MIREILEVINEKNTPIDNIIIAITTNSGFMDNIVELEHGKSLYFEMETVTGASKLTNSLVREVLDSEDFVNITSTAGYQPKELQALFGKKYRAFIQLKFRKKISINVIERYDVNRLSFKEYDKRKKKLIVKGYKG